MVGCTVTVASLRNEVQPLVIPTMSHPGIPAVGLDVLPGSQIFRNVHLDI